MDPIWSTGKWGALCELGGLEIGNLTFRNKALLAKWLWRVSFVFDSLWHRIIVNKHGTHPFEWTTKGLKAHIVILGKISLLSF